MAASYPPITRSVGESIYEHVAATGKCSDVFVQALEREGVEYVFGIPGEENLDILDSLRKSDKIKLILTRHEQAAGFMASIVGRLTGKPGVCISTLGPGATNFATSAAYAQLGGFPCFILTGQKPIRFSKQGAFQILDVVSFMRPMTKFTKQVAEASAVPHLIREAWKQSVAEKPGPVHLELPEDIAEMQVAEGTHFFPQVPVRRPVVDTKAVAFAAEILKKARSPLICVGAGANRALVRKQLEVWIDKYKIHAICCQMGKGVVSEKSPSFLATAALSAGDVAHVCAEHADVIIMLGHDVSEKPPFFMHANEKTVIHISFDEAQVDPVYFPQCELVGDIANALWQISELLGDAAPEQWDFRFFQYVRENASPQKLVDSVHATSDEFPMNIQRVVRELREALDDDAILCLDNGMYKLHVARLYSATSPNTVLLDNALATMGAGLPAALAAKLLYPTKQVVGLGGDGGFMMNSQELETAVRCNIHTVFVIVNDNAYGMIRWKQGTSNMPDFGLTLQNPDFVKYAESYGAEGHRVGSAGEFSTILRHCLAVPAVHVIEVPINYKSSDLELNVELKDFIANLRNVSRSGDYTIELPKAVSRPIPTGPLPTSSSDTLADMVGPLASKELVSAPDSVAQRGAVWPVYIGGKAELRHDTTLAVTDKYTNEEFTHVSLGSADDVNKAIEAAQKSLPEMQAMPAYQRKAILVYCAAEFRLRLEEFAYYLAREAGKPIVDARGEVNRLIDTFEIAAEEAVRQYGEYAPLDISARNAGVQSIVRRFPIGVVSMISPFNFPLNLTAHKIAPAIACGCPWVLKPASRTPIGALMIAEALNKCPDMPKGAFSVLTCNRTVGDIFVTDERLKLLTFTGSPSVGWDMKARCGKKKVVLELGGNAACVVDSLSDPSDVGIDALVKRLVFGSFYQSGQSCIHLQRLFIHESLYDKVVPALVEATKALKKGNPLQEDCFVGPLITEGDAKRIEKWVNDALMGGGKLLAGGKRFAQVYDATIVEDVPHDCELWVEEAFAPAIAVEKYSDFKAVIDEVNSSKFGIHMGLFTTDINKSVYAWEHCDVGGVVVGDIPSYRCDAQPYGGVKDSGIGREGIRYAIEDMTEMRVMLLKNIGQL